MSIHLNSLVAFRESGKDFSEREAAIVLHLLAHPKPVTDRQLAAAMGFDHRSAVQPRVSDLIKDGIIEQYSTTRCQQTGKTVRTVALSALARANLPAAWQKHETRGRPTNVRLAAKANAQPNLF